VDDVAATRPRLAPLSREGWDEKTPNILRTVAHHPDLLGPFLGFAAALARGALPRRASELLALRAAWNCRSAFEWGHHARYARDAGLDEAEIARVARGPDDRGWDDEDRALLCAADELHAGQRIEEDTWNRLVGTWSNAQLVEIPFVVGHYSMLAMVCGATGVAIEPGLPALPSA
jgi:alkylhydroperoxidase family enzyme